MLFAFEFAYDNNYYNHSEKPDQVPLDSDELQSSLSRDMYSALLWYPGTT